MAYLDTSLLVAALTNELRTKEIQEWLAVAANHGLRIASLDTALVKAADSLGVSAVLL